jgi:hypothetical protein
MRFFKMMRSGMIGTGICEFTGIYTQTRCDNGDMESIELMQILSAKRRMMRTSQKYRELASSAILN